MMNLTQTNVILKNSTQSEIVYNLSNRLPLITLYMSMTT